MYERLLRLAEEDVAALAVDRPDSAVTVSGPGEAVMSPEEAGRFLTDDLVRRYTLGDCGVLAHHLAVRNGWGVCVVGELDYSEFDEEYPEESYIGVESLQHAYAVRPDGALVDVRGVHPSSEADDLATARNQIRHDYPDAAAADALWNHEQWLDTDWGDPEWDAVDSTELAARTATAVTVLYGDAAVGTVQRPVLPVEVRDSSGDPVEVTPGVLDENADWVYRNGQCLALAVAMSERTGWPVHLRCFTDGDGYEDGEPVRYTNLRHAYVEAPDGSLWDVRGENDAVIVEEECRDFDGDAYLPARVVPSEHARGLLEEFGGFLEEQDVEVAASFVDVALGDW